MTEKTEVVVLPKEKGDKIRKILGENMSENGKPEENSEVPSEDKMKTFARQFIKAQDEVMEEIVAEDIEKKELEKGGKGFVGLRSEDIAKEQHHEQKGYASYEEMIRDVYERAKSSNSEIAKEAEEQKQRLLQKMLLDMKNNPAQNLNRTNIYPDFVKDALEKQNSKWRAGFEGKKPREPE